MLKVFLVFRFLILTVSVDAYIRVCYYTNWSQYRRDKAKFQPEDIDPNLCTHIIYSFSKITSYNKLDMVEWNDDQMFARIMTLKLKNPNLKILLAVGGWNHENDAVSKFSTMVNSQTNRNAFIKSTVDLLRQWNFDGLDLDWEYPSGRGNSPPGDKQMFTILCGELVKAFEADAVSSNKPRLLLTAAVSASYLIIDAGYEVKELGSLLSFINLMAYDLHGSWDNITGHHTAMLGDGGNLPYRNEYTVPYAIDYWIKLGFPANKIALGLATYGRAFFLNEIDKNSPASPTINRSWNKAPKGDYTGEEGFLAYYEICNMTLNIVQDNIVDAPYGYINDKWIGFDNQASLRKKVNTQIIAKGLAGAMFWALDLDDFNGNFCGNGRYPLISSVIKALENV